MWYKRYTPGAPCRLLVSASTWTSFLHSVIDLSTHRFDALAHDDECVLYRARKEEDGSEVLVLTPAVQYPKPEVLKRLEHEYSLRQELDREWAIRPLALNRREGQVMLVLEDPSPAAASLDRCLRPAGICQGGSEIGRASCRERV